MIGYLSFKQTPKYLDLVLMKVDAVNRIDRDRDHCDACDHSSNSCGEITNCLPK